MAEAQVSRIGGVTAPGCREPTESGSRWRDPTSQLLAFRSRLPSRRDKLRRPWLHCSVSIGVRRIPRRQHHCQAFLLPVSWRLPDPMRSMTAILILVFVLSSALASWRPRSRSPSSPASREFASAAERSVPGAVERPSSSSSPRSLPRTCYRTASLPGRTCWRASPASCFSPCWAGLC